VKIVQEWDLSLTRGATPALASKWGDNLHLKKGACYTNSVVDPETHDAAGSGVGKLINPRLKGGANSPGPRRTELLSGIRWSRLKERGISQKNLRGSQVRMDGRKCYLEKVDS